MDEASQAFSMYFYFVKYCIWLTFMFFAFYHYGIIQNFRGTNCQPSDMIAKSDNSTNEKLSQCVYSVINRYSQYNYQYKYDFLHTFNCIFTFAIVCCNTYFQHTIRKQEEKFFTKKATPASYTIYIEDYPAPEFLEKAGNESYDYKGLRSDVKDPITENIRDFFE